MASGHPKRWLRRHGAWYYQVPKADRHLWDGKTQFRLGKTDAEAYQTWFSRIQSPGKHKTMSSVMDAYLAEEVSKMKPSTQESYRYYISALRESFGGMRPADINPGRAYDYLEGRPRVAGNREISVLVQMLTFAIKLKLVTRNELIGQVRRNSEPPRKRLPDAAEIEAFLVDAHATLRHYVALKRITGLRRGQLLVLQWSNWDGEYLMSSGSKGGRDVAYHGEALDLVMGEIPRKGAYLFVKERRAHAGLPYTPHGFSSIFKRQMIKFMEKGGERFNEHDIRAFVATQAETLSHAQALLGHQDSKTTERVYRRGPVKVRVLSYKQPETRIISAQSDEGV